MKLKQITASLVAATMFASNPVFAQAGSKVSGDVVKIGVLTDLSSTYSDGQPRRSDCSQNGDRRFF